MKRIDSITRVGSIRSGAGLPVKKDSVDKGVDHDSDAIDYDELELRQRVTDKIHSSQQTAKEVSPRDLALDLEQLSRSVLGGGE